jgi:signal transduction histidine kinase
VAIFLVGTVAIIGSVGLFQLLSYVAFDDLRDRGLAAARDCATLARPGDPPSELPVTVAGVYLLQVIDESGRVYASSAALRGRPAMLRPAAATAGTNRVEILRVPDIADRVLVDALTVQTSAGPRTVLAAMPITQFTGARNALIAALALGVPLLLTLAYCCVQRTVDRALEPVRVMSRELAAVTGGHLDRRVTVPDTDDEVTGLARSVNVTLDRLQRLMEHQRRFVADASHELRSPLTALHAELEVALAHPEGEDWPAVARAALAGADRLQRIVTDLLELARLDAGVRADSERVDLVEMVRAEMARRPRDVAVDLDIADRGTAVVEGVAAQLVRVLVNLLDNAERHARSRIAVKVSTTDSEAVLEVADDGSGVAPEDRERIFQRFQRLAEGRRRDPGGSGLGLPIARDIALAHGGSLVAADPDDSGDSGGGARFVLRLPLVRAGGR